MKEKWRLLKDPPFPGETNMERDLEILEQVARGESPPTLRFYRWSPPAVSLGYSQAAQEVVDFSECRRLGIDVVRRPTGGRALLHYREVTYSVVISEDHPLVPPGIIDSYRFLSQGLVWGLEELGLTPQLAPEDKVNPLRQPGSCFDTPSAFELQVGRKKVVGSAQLRRRGVLLQHGSVLLELCASLNRQVLRLPARENNQSHCSLQEKAAGLWDLGLSVGIEKLVQVMQDSFAFLFTAEWVEESWKHK